MEWARWGFCLRAGDPFSFEFNVSRREKYRLDVGWKFTIIGIGFFLTSIF